MRFHESDLRYASFKKVAGYVAQLNIIQSGAIVSGELV